MIRANIKKLEASYNEHTDWTEITIAVYYPILPSHFYRQKEEKGELDTDTDIELLQQEIQSNEHIIQIRKEITDLKLGKVFLRQDIPEAD